MTADDRKNNTNKHTNSELTMGIFSTLRLSLLLFIHVPAVDSVLGPNGQCALFTFVPFSLPESIEGLEFENTGMTHMASALLAMEHFNARNTSVVPELADFVDCPIIFDMNKSAVFNSEAITHASIKALFATGEIPCAVAGPFNDIPALELSTVAIAANFSVTAHRAFNLRVLASYASPYTTLVYPDMLASANLLVDSLLRQNRTDYIAIIYAVTDTGTQRREGLSFTMDTSAMVHRPFGYASSLLSPLILGIRDLTAALKDVKASGYRTIVVAMESPRIEIPLLAAAANELGLTNGDYMWVFFGDFDPALFFTKDEGIQQFLAGSQWLIPVERYLLDDAEDAEDPFLRAWRTQGQTAIDRLNAANPISEGEEFYEFVNRSNYFQSTEPDYGSGFMYDSVIATGMGACLGLSDDGNLTVEAHVNGTRSAKFTGATGDVRFGATEGSTNAFGSGDIPPGARDPLSVAWALLNLIPPVPSGNDTPVELTSVWENNQWFEIYPMYYADGRTVPPDLLRDQPDQNYLNSGLQGVGFALLGLGVATAIAAAVWVYRNREHRVLRASQPFFLYELCWGSVVSLSTIMSISFDESDGWSEKQLSRACMATPWLLCLGHMITVGALFSKLWRIQQVLQFARRKIKVRHVAWPSAILNLSAITLLGLWTGLDSMQWTRTESDSFTGESIGECRSEHFAAFVTPLIFLMLIPTIMTMLMAWKTKDIDGAYSESYWICMMLIVQFEVTLVAVPMIFLLRDVSTDARYIGFVFFIWTFPMSSLLLIFVPKIVTHYRETHGLNGPDNIRGERSRGTRVSGLVLTELPSPSPPATATHHTVSGSSHGDESHPPEQKGLAS